MAVAVPADKVPAEMAMPPFNVSVVVLPPIARVCPVLLTPMLLKVCEAAVPLMFCPALVFVKFTVLLLGVKVPPLLVQFPPVILIVLAVPALKVPEVSVMTPLMSSVVVLPPIDRIFEVLATVTLLKFWLVAVPLMAWSALVLLKVTVLVPGLKVPLLVQLPPTVVVYEPPESVALLLMVTLPPAVMLAPMDLVPELVTVRLV